jgi:hypothetical protein
MTNFRGDPTNNLLIPVLRNLTEESLRKWGEL